MPVTADALRAHELWHKPYLAHRLPYEIKACCRLASLLDVPLIEAATNIVPVAVTAGESIERLRQWASGRCLCADRPGLFTRGGDVAGKRRKVNRSDPSVN